jgi:flavin-binding protein dodecin
MKGTAETGRSVPEERFLPIDTVFKSIELIAESDKSWEHAAQQCVSEASETLKNIKELKVESMKALIENGKIARYRVRCRVAFAVDNKLRSH